LERKNFLVKTKLKFQVYESLKGHEGFDAYRRDEIPDIYRYKKSRLALEILLVAKPNYFIEGLDSPKQIPRELPNNRGYRGGTHGYPNMTEMRTIFFAKGPGSYKNSLLGNGNMDFNVM